jgi:hypothetical protein
MLNYIKSVIRSFFSTPSTIVFIEPIEEEVVEEPKVKKASKKSLKTKHKPRARARKNNGKATYPYWTTPVGAGFVMNSLMAGSIRKRMAVEGIYYSQHKISNGKYLAFRKA